MPVQKLTGENSIGQQLFNKLQADSDCAVIVFGANSNHVLKSRYGSSSDGGQAEPIYQEFGVNPDDSKKEHVDFAPFVTRDDDKSNLCNYYNNRLEQIIREYHRLGGKIYFPFKDNSEVKVNIGTNRSINSEVQKKATELYTQLSTDVSIVLDKEEDKKKALKYYKEALELLEKDVRDLNKISQDDKILENHDIKNKLEAFYNFSNYNEFISQDQKNYDNLKLYKSQNVADSTDSKVKILDHLDKINRRQYLNPDQYYGIGAELKYSFEHDNNYYFQFTDKYKGSLAEKLGINVGDYLIINENKLNEEERKIDPILLVTRMLRSNSLEKISYIGKYDITDDLNNNEFKKICEKYTESNPYKKNFDGKFVIKDNINLLDIEKNQLSQIEVQEDLTILDKYNDASNEQYKEYLIKKILELDITKQNKDDYKRIIQIIHSHYDKLNYHIVNAKYAQIINNTPFEGGQDSDLLRDVDKTCEEIKHTKKWADEFTIYGLAKQLNVVANIHYEDTTLPTQPINQSSANNDKLSLDFHYITGLHYKSREESGNPKEVMQVVGDCFYDSFLHQLYLKKDQDQVRDILKKHDIKLDDDGYYDKQNDKLVVNNKGLHTQNISKLRELAAEGYRDFIEEISNIPSAYPRLTGAKSVDPTTKSKIGSMTVE